MTCRWVRAGAGRACLCCLASTGSGMATNRPPRVRVAAAATPVIASACFMSLLVQCTCSRSGASPGWRLKTEQRGTAKRINALGHFLSPPAQVTRSRLWATRQMLGDLAGADAHHRVVRFAADLQQKAPAEVGAVDCSARDLISPLLPRRSSMILRAFSG